ncbi:BrnT family toxin [Patescibacteria group bacterium]|nr:BrnT family toxin [Patescibacteria group bacterium]
MFFDNKKVILKDPLHPGKELRYIILGKTKTNRLLFTVFTLRNNKIRIISSRDINKKEIKFYEKRT